MTNPTWMTVFTYIDEHPDTLQADVVQDFATQQTGGFTSYSINTFKKVTAVCINNGTRDLYK